jgi:formylglycine-generating enzyme required for sulfatase activity
LREEWHWLQAVKPYMEANVRPNGLTADAERELKLKDTFEECSEYCPEMVVIPSGWFMMGSPEDEKGRDPDEGPLHKVTIVRPFAVSKFDVTFEQYYLCVWMKGCRMVSDGNMGAGSRPVINVTWYDAQSYVNWLSKFTGRPYRLLTEAEWEYSARAGTTTDYYWGRDFVRGKANCNNCGSEWDARQTSPVGSFPPNPFGLYDMVGNVYQWLQDCYYEDYREAPMDGSAQTHKDCSVRAGRGSDWGNPPQQLRSAWRGHGPADFSDLYTGFRVARTLAVTKLDVTSSPEVSR